MKNLKFIVLIIIALGLIVACGSGEKNTSPPSNGKYDLGTSTRAWKDVRMTGKLYSDGVAVINNGSITGSAFSTSDIYIGAVTSGTATVAAGSTIIGFYPFANVNDGDIDIANSVSITGTTLKLIINGTNAGPALHYKVVTAL